VPLRRRLAGLAAVVAAAVALSGCFTGDYDIAVEVRPETPLAAGRYQSDTNEVMNVSLSGNVYTAVAPGDDPAREPTYLQFFQVPDSDLYVVKAWTDPTVINKNSYVYFYARVSGGGVAFMSASYDNLPPDLQALVRHDGVDMILRDGPRDSLHLVREVARRGTKLDPAGTYRRATP